MATNLANESLTDKLETDKGHGFDFTSWCSGYRLTPRYVSVHRIASATLLRSPGHIKNIIPSTKTNARLDLQQLVIRSNNVADVVLFVRQ